MNIEELKKEVEELKAKIAEFEEQKGDDWVPKYGQKYYFISTAGYVSGDTWYNMHMDLKRLAFHNVYPTKDMAQSAPPDMTRCNTIIRACRLVEPGFVPDWGDQTQWKFYPKITRGIWRLDNTNISNCAPAYVSGEKKCECVCDLLTKWEVK